MEKIFLPRIAYSKYARDYEDKHISQIIQRRSPTKRPPSEENQYSKYNHNRRQRRNKRYLENLQKLDKSNELVCFNPFLFQKRNRPKEKNISMMNKKANLELVHNVIINDLYRKNALPVAKRR